MELSIPEAIGGIFLIIIINIIVWAFVWGRTVGKICERIDNIEEKIDGHIERHPKPYVLPECHQTFKDIASSLASLKTQMSSVVSDLGVIKDQSKGGS